MEHASSRYERLLTPRRARWTLVLLGLITLGALLTLRNARLDYDFEKFFPNNDPELDRYEAFRHRFGYDNDFVMVGIEREQGVFDRDLLERVEALAERLAVVPHIRSVASPTDLEEPIVTPLGVFSTPYLRFGNDTLIAIDSARIWNDPRVKDLFFSDDAKAMIVLLQADPGLSKVRSDSLVTNISSEVEGSGLRNVRLAGRIFGQHHYIVKMTHEMAFFFGSSLLLLTIFLWFGFRSVRGVVVPIAVVGLAILWQVAFMTLVGKPLSILTMLLPTILFVVGMSDVVHILEFYLDEIRKGTPRIRAIATTYNDVGLPTLLTAITAAIGFSTLGTASIPPLQEFGLYTGIGVLLAFVLAFTLLPALLVLTPPEKLLPAHDRPSPWDRRLPDLFRFTLRNRRWILLGFAAIAVVGTIAALRIKVNNFLLEDLPDNDEQKSAFLWFEKKFGGVRPFELEIVVSDTGRTVWDPVLLAQLEKVQDHIASTYGVKGILSPVTVIRSLNKAFNGGAQEFYRLPQDPAECARLARKATLLGRGMLSTLVSADGRSARLTGRMIDEGGFVHKGKNAELDAFIHANTDERILHLHQTGMAWLIDRNNATLSTQLVGGMGLAIVLTALIMLWFFRDWRMVLVALIPNLVPLAFIAGVMGVAGIDLKVSTAIIFSIAFGIAEDDTIHMLASLRLHMRAGSSPVYALKRTYLSTGKAITVTSLMLISGFVTLVFSDFASVYYMGLLITLTLAFAFVAELLLLPALVLTLMRPRARRS